MTVAPSCDDDRRSRGRRPGIAAARVARPQGDRRGILRARRAGRLERLARELGLAVPLALVGPEEAAAAFDRALPVVSLTNAADARPGEPNPRFAAATIESIERAVEYVRSGAARAVVTNPIAKKTLYEAGFAFPGHTEYLGALARATGAGDRSPS